jgi:hypothetical protein
MATFRQTHDHRDLQAISNLVCWDRVTPELRKLTEDNLRTTFDDKIEGVKLNTEHPQGRPDVYKRNGITYRFIVLALPGYAAACGTPRSNWARSRMDSSS